LTSIASERPYVLIIDDDPNLVMFLGDRLRRDGYEVSFALDGREALAQIGTRWPDLIMLDLMLPGMGGEEVARQIKHRADIPVIVLSAVAAHESKVEMISRYAEDYVTKPFDYSELEARMRRILHRVGSRAPKERLILGPSLTIMLGRRRAFVDGREVTISATESRLLYVLAGRLGTTFSTNELLANVWSASDGADPAYVWVNVRRLRQKLELDPDHPVHLVSVPGGGYRLVSLEPSIPSES